MLSSIPPTMEQAIDVMYGGEYMGMLPLFRAPGAVSSGIEIFKAFLETRPDKPDYGCALAVFRIGAKYFQGIYRIHGRRSGEITRLEELAPEFENGRLRVRIRPSSFAGNYIAGKRSDPNDPETLAIKQIETHMAAASARHDYADRFRKQNWEREHPGRWKKPPKN